MAVWVYMNDKAELIEPEQLQSSISAGWSLEPGEKAEPDSSVVEPVPLDQGTNESLQADIMEASAAAEEETEEALTNEQIRQMAQEAGLDNWQSAQIRTLKASLGIE